MPLMNGGGVVLADTAKRRRTDCFSLAIMTVSAYNNYRSVGQI